MIKMFSIKNVGFVSGFILLLTLYGCAKLKYNPGTYTARSEGHNGPVIVSVTFSNSAITDIKIDRQSETPGIGAEALKKVAGNILIYQSLDVDIVSAASVSSNAMLTAVEECAKQAGADVSLLKKKK